MECECSGFSMRHDPLYGEATIWLAERKRDCTVIDAGFGGNIKLHELQRHLRKHGIKARTIGIDTWAWNAEVNEFIQANIVDVKLPGIADLVVFNKMVHMFDDDPAEFKKVIESCAG